MPYKKIPTQEPKQDVEAPALVAVEEKSPPSQQTAVADQRRADREARREALRAKREAAQQGRTRKPSKDVDTDEGEAASAQSRLLGNSTMGGGAATEDSSPTKKVGTSRPPPRRSSKDERNKPLPATTPADDPFATLGISAKPKIGEGGRAAEVVVNKTTKTATTSTTAKRPPAAAAKRAPVAAAAPK